MTTSPGSRKGMVMNERQYTETEIEEILREAISAAAACLVCGGPVEAPCFAAARRNPLRVDIIPLCSSCADPKDSRAGDPPPVPWRDAFNAWRQRFVTETAPGEQWVIVEIPRDGAAAY